MVEGKRHQVQGSLEDQRLHEHEKDLVTKEPALLTMTKHVWLAAALPGWDPP